MSNGGGEFLPRETISHLLVGADEMCWWCQKRTATTGEHKYKAADLTRMMGDDYLIWGDDTGRIHEIRGKSGIQRDRYKVVKFPKSMCDTCNNTRSQPFDRAYDVFSNYLFTNRHLRLLPGVDFRAVYGATWERDALNLARYYGKHFGCQMVKTGVAVPQSLRDFLDGGTDMADAHMALVTTDTVHRATRSKGLTISPGAVFADPGLTRIRGCVFACYVGSVGVRYQWNEAAFSDVDRSQFFHYPNPVINCFTDEQAVAYGSTRRPGRLARFLQWLNSGTERGDRDS
jgi:hypothetical protein